MDIDEDVGMKMEDEAKRGVAEVDAEKIFHRQDAKEEKGKRWVDGLMMGILNHGWTRMDTD